jgi:hypothetical protein
MATQPIRTHTSRQIIEALDELWHMADLNTDGEMDTTTRIMWRAKRDSIDVARTVVRGLLPYVETDAVQKVFPHIGLIDAENMLDSAEYPQDDPTDPSLPFVRVSA